MKFFLPDWEDRVDPSFSFKSDEYSEGHRKNQYLNDKYAHQVYSSKSPYDGMLVSLSNFESKISLSESHGRINFRGKTRIRDYLKLSDYPDIKVMGDCGAYSYINEEVPPEFYSVKHVASLYDKLGFDYGVSVDHIVVDHRLVKEDGKRKYIVTTPEEKQRRIDLTMKNAEKFRYVWENNDYNFKPVGVAQGYDPATYVESVKRLRELEYDYIALGGLVQYSNEVLLRILNAVSPLLNGIKLHLFGVLRPGLMNKFEQLGVTSFDSASYLRKAWLRSGQNYLSPDGEWYSAIRVPYSWNKNLLENAKKENISQEKIKELEARALKAVRDFDNGKEKEIEKTLSAVIDYDRLLFRSSKDERNLEKRYEKTLRWAPWKNCTCDICREIGVDVIIFRGTNRNKRRGFHNTWVSRNILSNNHDHQINSTEQNLD